MQIFDTSTTFTRPADTTAYTANDLVANSTTAGSVVPMTFNITGGRNARIWRAYIQFNSATVTNAKFNLHLYLSSPTCTNGDNGAWLTTNSGYQGFIAVDATGQTFSDNTRGYGVYVNNSVFAPMYVQGGFNQQIFGLLQATAAYTPTSAEVFTVGLIGESLV